MKTSFSRSTPVQIQCAPMDTIVNGNSQTIGSDNEYGSLDKRIHRTLSIFFSSGMADVALWLGPYMSINCQNFICTRTQKVHKCRQIKSPNNTQDTQPRRPANPPARFAFRQKNNKPDRQKGQEPKQQNPQKDLPRDTADFTTVSHSKTCIN